MINGQLAADPSDDLSIILVGDTNWSDYVIEVDVYSYSAAGFPIGIIVRANRGSYLIFQTHCCDSNWILVTGTSERIIAHLDEGGLSFASSGYAKNRIRVEVIGQTFTAYVDGKLYLQVYDPTLPSGRVGIACQYPHDNTCKFDNFRVAAP